MTFDEIEDCFPFGSSVNEYGEIVISAQWLHDFARNVEDRAITAEREVSDKLLEALKWAREVTVYPEELDAVIAEVEELRRSERSEVAMREEKE